MAWSPVLIPQRRCFNITIRNGTIAGFGADGVHILGDNVLIEDLRVRNNGLSGIVVRSTGFNDQLNLIIRRNTVQWNSSYGIKSYAGLITENTIAHADVGITVEVGGGLVSHNMVSNSQSFGLALVPNASYYGNVLVNNNGPGAQVVSGVNMGQNLCNTSACP